MIKNFTILCCLILTLAASSCKKSDISGIATDRSNVSIINASPSLATYNVYLDNSKANNAALPIGGVINYLDVSSGAHTMKFTTASSTESLLTKTLNLAGATVYSQFLISVDGKLDVVSSTDVIASGKDQALIRFANMSPDAPALTLITRSTVVEEPNKELVSNAAFKSVSEFSTLAPKEYTLDVKNKVTGELIGTLNKVTLSAGRYYTVLVRGMVSNSETEHPAGVQLITNL